jgi:gluconokinase
MDRHAAHNRPMVVVVMGVSSSGKTTVAKLLAETLGWQYQEGDALHPPENVAKMSSGTPLTDADRLPWLRAIAARIDEWRSRGEPGVVTCSALKHAYRDIIVGNRPDVVLVYLKGSHDLIAARMAARKGHFMPTALLDNQFATLEEPSADERAITIDVGETPFRIVQEIMRRLVAGTGSLTAVAPGR